MAERHRAHCVSLRHCVTPLHHQSTPGDVVVAVDVDVGKSRAVVDAVVVDVGLTSSQRASLTVVATMSTITRNGSHEDLVILPRHGATSTLSLCWGHTLDNSESECVSVAAFRSGARSFVERKITKNYVFYF